MSIQYRFTIAGNEITEKDNIRAWNKFVTNIKRDSSDLKGLLVSNDFELEITGDLYKEFENDYFFENICREYTCLIEQSFDEGINFETLFEGILFLKDFRIKDALQGIGTIKFTDNSFYARIDKNKSIATNPRGGYSKSTDENGNGIPITACVEYDVTVYNPADNSTNYDDATPIGTRKMLKVVDVMEYLVRWMSDDEVGFRSDFLDTELQLFITNGYYLRTNTTPSPFWEVSFARLYDNIRKSRNIGFTIEYDANNKPILRLEKASYFYDQTIQRTFSNPEKIESNVTTQELYAKVRLGSDKTNNAPFLSFLEDMRYNGFKEEELYVDGQCNIDATLDLVRDMIISSNVIENILIEQHGIADPADIDTSNDDDLILIWATVNDGAHTGNAIMTNPEGTPPPAYYNMTLRNSEVGSSFFTDINSGLVAGFLNFTVNDFQANITNNQDNNLGLGFQTLDVNPIIYNTETDPGGNFNLATGFYICPATGIYTFNFYLITDMPGNPANNTGIDQYFFRIVDDAGNVLKEGSFSIPLKFGTNYTEQISVSIFRNAGDLVGTSIHVHAFNVYNTNVRILAGTYFSATATPLTGGIVQTYKNGDLRKILIKFNHIIPQNEFDSILQNLRKQYAVEFITPKSGLRKLTGWIDDLKYDQKTSKANIILKSDVNTILKNK